jgi:4-amino-4-deoxy-L-arabinose transferase-like glycosyltransferase
MKSELDANKVSWMQNPTILSLIIFVITFIIRAIFLGSIYEDPTFQMPIIDSLEFNIWAYEITHGQYLWNSLQNHPPLYAYFLALIYSIAGFNPVAVALVQYALFALSTVLLFWIVHRLTNPAVAAICAFIMATYWFFIYTNTFIFSENLCLFLDICFIYVLLFHKESIKKYIFAGLLLGLSVICRPELLVFLFLAPLWFLANKLTLKDIMKYSCSLALAAALIILPVLVYNSSICGSMLLRSDIGANIYIGNSYELKGSNIHLEIGKDWEKFIGEPHVALKKKATPSEANQYFINKTKESILHDPLQWIKFISAKAFALLTGTEFLRTEDVYAYTYYVLNTPYVLISTKMIYLLALIGLVLGLKNYRQLLLAYLMVLAYLPMAFFPLKTRYLMPSMPFVILFAGIAIYYLFTMIQTKKYFQLLILTIGILLLNFISYYNFIGFQPPTVSETYYAIGKNYAVRSQFQKAINFLQAAIKINPKNPSIYNDLGVYLMHEKNFNEAMKNFKIANDLDPTLPYPKLNMALCQKLMSQ